MRQGPPGNVGCGAGSPPHLHMAVPILQAAHERGNPTAPSRKPPQGAWPSARRTDLTRPPLEGTQKRMARQPVTTKALNDNSSASL